MKILRVILATALAIAFFAIIGRAGYWDCHYYRYGKITKIDNGIISVEDNRGYIWECPGKGFTVGSIVKLLMFTNYTDSNIFDDKIEGIFSS